jgi:hypothetical protein
MGEKLYFLEFAAKLIGGPRCFLLVPPDELLIPISPLFQLRYNIVACGPRIDFYQLGTSLFEGRRDM